MPPQMTFHGTMADDPLTEAPPTPIKLVVLQAMTEGCVYEDDDSPADVGSHFKRAGYDHVEVENVFLSPQNYAPTLVQLAKRTDVHCFVNLCDGAWDEPSVGMQVVDLLETKLNVPFTGADMRAFEPGRLEMKKAALACGVKVPAWRFVYSMEDLDTFLAEFGGNDKTTTAPPPLKFPLLAKHFSSYSSVGLIKESKVWDVEGLRKQCTRMIETYGGCLVEEFIEGREFTVLACQIPTTTDGNDGLDIDVMAYEPVECRFKEGDDFKHYNLKWVDYEELSWHPIPDKDLSERLKSMAVDVFRSIRGRGYGRIDVRSDPSGENLYFLEINPNCGVFYPEGLYGSADFILDLKQSRTAHADFCLAQVEVSRRLWQKSKMETSLFEARYDARKESWGLIALRPIKAGQIIRHYEEGALHLVSKSHVMRNWKGAPANYNDGMIHNSNSNSNNNDVNNNNNEKKTFAKYSVHHGDSINLCWDNFQAYCWPVSDNLFAMWDPDPNKWQPINHNCDPNAWNQEGNGLDLVARRDIQANEEITMDYATFCGFFPEMKSFTCGCGSSMCRGTITGMDIVHHPELRERYAGHMSDYVATKANSLQLKEQ